MSKTQTPPQHELTLRNALSAVADKHGKVEVLRIVAEWTRTKLDDARTAV